MPSPLLRVSRKALILLGVLALMAVAGPVAPTRPAFAVCQPKLCPFNPPMHWDCLRARCVCDCPVSPDQPTVCGSCA
ncbi:MAG TPA: hypothetical protein VGM86_30405 [Thermoanaerobaculia bacterium]|jgi:hypothetical protein